MKFIHLSDLHLGKRVNEFSMMEDQEYILEEILNIVDEEQPDGVTPNIIKITRKELNRRLGGMVVIIEDDEEEK